MKKRTINFWKIFGTGRAVTDTHHALQQQAARSVDIALLVRNLLFGCFIVEFEQGAASRIALYGKQLMQRISYELVAQGVQGASPTSLR